jgi:hypothetical protein
MAPYGNQAFYATDRVGAMMACGARRGDDVI